MNKVFYLAATGAIMTMGLVGAAHAQSVDTRTTYSSYSYSDVDDGPYCREYQKSIKVGGKTQRAYGQACQQPDGSWKLENGTTVTDVSGYSWTTEETQYTEVQPAAGYVETVGYWDGPYYRHKRFYHDHPRHHWWE